MKERWFPRLATVKDLLAKAPTIRCKNAHLGCMNEVDDVDEYCDECLYERLKHEVPEEL